MDHEPGQSRWRTSSHQAGQARDDAIHFLERSERFDLLLESVDVWFPGGKLVSYDVVLHHQQRAKTPARDARLLFEAENIQRQIAVALARGRFDDQFEPLASIFGFQTVSHVS